MGFDDRLGFLLLGCFIGFILGYIVRSLRDIKEELDEVDDYVKNLKKDQKGYLRLNFGQIILLLVLALTIYGVVVAQLSSNKTNHTADVAADTAAQLKTVVDCNKTILGVTLVALNERSQFSVDAAEKNISLQESQHSLISLLLGQPPPPPSVGVEATQKYNDDVGEYINVRKKSLQTLKSNPIPTVDQFTKCINQAQARLKEKKK